MRQGMLILSVFLTGSLRAWLYFILAGSVLEKKNQAEQKRILLGSAGAGAAGALLFLLPVPDYGRMCLEALLMGGCGAYLLGTEVRMSLFLGAFYEIAFSLWQLLLSAALSLWRGFGVFLDGKSLEGQAGAWLAFGLLGLVALYGAKRPGMTEQEHFHLLSLPVLGGFLGIITLSEQRTSFIPGDVLDVWTMLSLVLLMGLLMFHMSRQYRMEKELARLKAEQAKLLERDYQALNQSYGANARLFHDMHRHLEALYRLLSQKHYEEAKRYLEDLQAPVREMAETVYTGDEAADYLLNSRMSAAAGEGISLEIKAEFPRHTNIRSADLCAILGNLLDNALEAAGKVKEPGERSAALTIRRIHQMLVIKVENTFAEDIKEDDGELKTSKTDGGLHGWGLKSVRTAAEKYEGTLRTSWEGNRFRAVVTLAYQSVSEECFPGR